MIKQTGQSRRSVWLVGVAKVIGAGVLCVGLLVAPSVFAEAAWESQNPAPAEYYLSGVWGFSGDDVFAVGEDGTILHYDGTEWSSMSSGTTSNLEAVWGTAGNNIYAVGEEGTILHYDGSAWSPMEGAKGDLFLAVWGTGRSDVYAAGLGVGTGSGVGVIYRYDGKTWTEVKTVGFGCVDIWGTARDGIFVATSTRPVFHFDGAEWSSEYVPQIAPARRSPAGIWGFSGTDLFVVGAGGGIYHFDGEKWSKMTSGTKLFLDEVWGSASDDVFAVGKAGTMLHYDGESWSAMESGTDVWLKDVWGTASDDVFVVGEDGTILHYGIPQE